MTIAIGAVGPGAGRAVLAGLKAAELVAQGAIGGFVVLAAISQAGELLRYQTQRGGTRTLFIDGETTGVEAPQDVQTAISAALISSGPDRPEPLSKFLTAHPQAGLVTAHRVPQGPSVSGKCLNQDVLDRLLQGQSADEATASVLSQNPHADVGFITIDRYHRLYAQNAPKVAARPDIGQARREASSAAVEVLHNAIKPSGSLAPLVADIAFSELHNPNPIIGYVTVPAGIAIRHGPADAVLVDAAGIVQEIITTDPSWTQGERTGVGIYLHSEVRQGRTVLGKTLVEPFCVAQAGRLLHMSGQHRLTMAYTSV